MASEVILAVDEDIDDQIRDFCTTRPGLSPAVRSLIERKLEINARVSRKIRQRIDALDEPERRRRLTTPDDHVDRQHDFESLSYLHGPPPTRASITGPVQRVLLPILFD